MGKDFASQYMATVKKLREEGKSFIEASELADLDMKINQWPKNWGKDLQASIYGFLEIQVKVELPELGITIEPKKEVPKKDEGGFVFGAPYAYSAKVQVSSRDKEGVLDAINRLEKFLSAWRMTEWPGRAINYWCFLFYRSAGVQTCLDSEKLDNTKRALSAISKYTEHQQRLIWQAAWWLRQCEEPFFNNPNPSVFREYLAYWNALECLTEAICDMGKPKKLTKSQKNTLISNYITQINRTPTYEDINKLYNQVVNPGLPQKVKQALSVCFGVVGEQYHRECFKKQPKESQLYQIRNDIAHGNIVEYEFDKRLRVEEALSRLHIIVNNMLSILSHQSLMLDRHTDSCYTCANHSAEGICSLSLLPPNERYWRFMCNKYGRNKSMPQ